MNIAEKAVTFIPCPRCGATPKEPCRTGDGSAYSGRWYAHQARKEPFQEEFVRGYRLGLAAKE